jgi:transposase-like protein
MKKTKSLYHGHRFPAAAISCAVRWYFRFSLSLRDIEELLLERGVAVTYETIRCWCDKFGARFARFAKAARRNPGSTWHLDEMFVTLRGEPYLLWRAVDEHGVELDVLVQKRRDDEYAELVAVHGVEAQRLVLIHPGAQLPARSCRRAAGPRSALPAWPTPWPRTAGRSPSPRPPPKRR